jgi:hypothetical protein
VRPHRNITGYPLEIRRFNNHRVGPGEVIDLDDLGHDPDEHGVITGLEPVTEEPEAAPPKPTKASKTAAQDKEQNQ